MKIESGNFYNKDNSGFSIWNDSAVYKITNYQRPYVWSIDQAAALLEDLSYLGNPKHKDESVAWPGILIQESDSDQGNIRTYIVGDGQQRLTTIYLAYLAIWQTVESISLTNPEIKTSIEYVQMKSIVPEYNELESSIKPGILASYVRKDGALDLRQKLEFRDDDFNSSIEDLFKRLTFKENEAIVKEKMARTSKTSNLHRVYQYFRENFEKMTLKEIHSNFENLSTRIVLPVSIYEKQENMLRSFSNMNSKGVTLTEGDLIKAGIFATSLKIHYGEKTSVKFIDFWNSTLDYGLWKEIIPTSNFNEDGVKHTHLTKFILEYYHYRTNWENYRSGKQDYRVGHWLRDSFERSILSKISNKKELDDFFDDFRKKSELYALWNFRISNHRQGSLDWFFTYGRGIIKAKHVESTFFAIADLDVSEIEKIEIVILLLRWNLFLVLNGDPIPRKSYNRLLESGSPFIENDLSINTNEIEKHLSKKNGKTLWLGKEDLKESIKAARYSIRFHSGLIDTFVFMANKELRDQNIPNLYDPRQLIESNGLTKNTPTIEHILPQKPEKYKIMSADEKRDYDDLKKQIGNLLPLLSSQNSKANNSKIEEKVKIYHLSERSPWGASFVNYFFSIYKESGIWGKNEIERRGDFLADVLSSIFSSELESVANDEESQFSSILKTKREFSISDTDEVCVSGKDLKDTWLNYLKLKLESPIYLDKAEKSLEEGKRTFSDASKAADEKNHSEVASGIWVKNNPSREPSNVNFIQNWISNIESIFGLRVDFVEVEKKDRTIFD